MRDVEQRLAQQRLSGIRPVVVFELGVPDQGADPDVLGGDLDRVQAADPVDVDEVGRRGQAHVEDRDEALSAGEDLAVMADLGEHGDGGVDAARRVVLEG